MALRLDADGHLARPGDWSEDAAHELADAAGVELAEAHWRVIALLREFYAETGVAPSMRPLVALLRERGAAETASSIELLKLFPGSPARLAAKIAGLPRPDKCL